MLAIFALLIVLGDLWIKIFKLEEGKKVKKFPLNILVELAYGGGITFSFLPWPLKDEDFNNVEAKKLCKKRNNWVFVFFAVLLTLVILCVVLFQERTI